MLLKTNNQEYLQYLALLNIVIQGLDPLSNKIFAQYKTTKYRVQ